MPRLLEAPRGEPVAAVEESREEGTPLMANVSGKDEEPPWGDILVAGPLQQQSFLAFWRWRWCVLDRSELRVYSDEAASILAPETTLQRYCISALQVDLDRHIPTTLMCTDVESGLLAACFRTGGSQQWEELVSASLWVQAFAAAGYYFGR